MVADNRFEFPEELFDLFMAKKESLAQLMQLLHSETINMEVMQPLQDSGTLLLP